VQQLLHPSAPEETTVKKTLLIATAPTIWALLPSAAQDTSSVLHSLPAEVQKNIEEVRANCRAYWNNQGIADPSDFLVSSGDEGLISFTLSGAQAVMVSNLNLCAGQCLKGVTCSTVPFYEINIYVRTGQAWRNALSAGFIFWLLAAPGMLGERICELWSSKCRRSASKALAMCVPAGCFPRYCSDNHLS
jgi:hypothetical protein